MHIGFITSEYPHPLLNSHGGIGTSILNLAFGLKRLGCFITIFVYGQDNDDEFYDQEIRIVKIKNFKLKGLSWLLTRVKIQRIVNREIVRSKIQIIEAPDWIGITAFMKLVCPLIIKLHGSDAYFCHLDKRPIKLWNYFLERKALTSADAHISVSEFTAKISNKVFRLNYNYNIIPNGIKPFEIRYLEKETFRTEQNLKILYAGTLIRKKGALELPIIFNEVIQSNKAVRLIIVGADSPDIKTGNRSTWEIIKPLFSKEALERVKFCGKVPHEKMAEFYRSADVCIFPSYAEAFPVSWLEAMALGKAVVASDIGWAHEVIEDGISGILCNPSEHNKFAGNIAAVLKDNTFRTYLGDNARLRVENNFTAEIIAEKALNFYKNVIASLK